ncbi:MAG: hypothetical protein UHM23_05935 [Clostridia bacterium]|nr:hypothetical protein [Clostridia bacterium]
MYYPRLQELERYRDMTSVFGGYNHQLTCGDGQFYDMQNMTSSYYPILSPRKERGIIKALKNPQGILDKEDMYWIDDKVLYKNGKTVELKNVSFNDKVPKTMTKMGAYVVVLPDKIWFNAETLECGYMENRVEVLGDYTLMYSLCKADGSFIEWKSEDYYKENTPKNGDYMLTINSSGGMSLKVYSSATGIWNTEATTYIQISAPGIGVGFEKDDGVKITASSNKRLANVLINKEKDGRYSVNTTIIDRTNNSIIIPGILSLVTDTEDEESSLTEELVDLLEEEGVEPPNPNAVEVIVERLVPDMEYITECGNRLWGGSTDGHEVYCCKLGDVKNWNSFNGISTDSWAATVGSDGKFTGAVTYLGYPMLFKEDSFIKIAISTTGGHQTKETVCRGVQKGSGASLVVLNETLFYKSSGCICGYNGSLPFSISDELGADKYCDAVAGAFGDKYYISMRGSDGKYDMFVYDIKNGLWCREDDTRALFFCRHNDELCFVNGSDFKLYSVGGTIPYSFDESGKEKPSAWFAESGAIGYSSPDNKYVARITIRISLEVGTNVDFYLQYDSCGEWEHKFNMSGTGTRTFSIPIIPRRCDHFKYKIVGKGDCKIHSITKTIEEGSDV